MGTSWLIDRQADLTGRRVDIDEWTHRNQPIHQWINRSSSWIINASTQLINTRQSTWKGERFKHADRRKDRQTRVVFRRHDTKQEIWNLNRAHLLIYLTMSSFVPEQGVIDAGRCISNILTTIGDERSSLKAQSLQVSLEPQTKFGLAFQISVKILTASSSLKQYYTYGSVPQFCGAILKRTPLRNAFLSFSRWLLKDSPWLPQVDLSLAFLFNR